MFGLLLRLTNNWAHSQSVKLLAWVASSLQSRETNVADFACVLDRNFSTKIKAKISNGYSLNDATNIRLRFYAVFHSPNSRYPGISIFLQGSLTPVVLYSKSYKALLIVYHSGLLPL